MSRRPIPWPKNIELRVIPGFANYRAGSDGMIWRGGRQLKPDENQGYAYVRLSKPSRQQSFRVHRLIALCWYGPRPAGKGCAHADGNGLNNKPENLSCKTHKENCADKHRHGTRQIGERAPSVKLNNKKVMEIRRLSRKGMSDVTLAKRYNVGWTAIHRVVKRITWGHLP